MRTMHVGLEVEDHDRSLAFSAHLGYEVVGMVPETEFGSLTMLTPPGDELVSLELVHHPPEGRSIPEASTTSSSRWTIFLRPSLP